MNLLAALLELDRQTEGRRVEMKNLLWAVDRVLEVALRELREGDVAMVGTHRYHVEMRDTATKDRIKVLTVDNGVLGSRLRHGPVYASLEDNETFVWELPTVLRVFAETVHEHRTRIVEAANRALDVIPALIDEQKERL